MRLVADTNIVVSALLWRGPPHKLFERMRETALTFYTSPVLLEELADVLSRRKLAKTISALNATPESLLRDYRGFARNVRPSSVPRVVIDPDDDHVLACALTAHADLIASGDRHLLDLGEYRGIRIVTAVEAVRIVTEA